jgi:hypothetical protein
MPNPTARTLVRLRRLGCLADPLERLIAGRRRRPRHPAGSVAPPGTCSRFILPGGRRTTWGLH